MYYSRLVFCSVFVHSWSTQLKVRDGNNIETLAMNMNLMDQGQTTISTGQNITMATGSTTEGNKMRLFNQYY